jgi:hypothetical protein
MQLTPMRFTTIEGTEVTVKVNSPKEAKAAIKELRHRKKEVGLHRRKLLRLHKAALKEQARADARRVGRRGLLGAIAKAGSLFRSNKPLQDLGAIEQELHLVDETTHNLDACILQIEGKLLLNG